MTFSEWLKLKGISTKKNLSKYNKVFDSLNNDKLTMRQFKKWIKFCEFEAPLAERQAFTQAWKEWKAVRPVVDRITPSSFPLIGVFKDRVMTQEIRNASLQQTKFMQFVKKDTP